MTVTSSNQCFRLVHLKGQCHKKFYHNYAEQNEATIPLLIYKTILKHQEKEIHEVLKEEQVIVLSSPF